MARKFPPAKPHMDLSVRLPRGWTPRTKVARAVLSAASQLKAYLDQIVVQDESLREGALDIRLVLSRARKVG